jgi:serine/threonine-protein kinase
VEPGDNVDRLTGSVSDGNPVDWEHIELDADLDSDTVRMMRDVARIAEYNRALQRSATPSAPPPSPQNPPLERWRDLTLMEPLGAGARGEVWRAWDSTLRRQVALKFLQTAPGESASAELLSEARALARIRHPGVVTVFGIAEDQGRFGMWMECIPGTSLAREIERVGPLRPSQVALIGAQICSALEALDAAGLVHRDIKPANILLEREDRAVLTDFGLGWRPALDDEETPRSSGTPLFMAPELLAGERPTPQSDLYALGVTLWWSLAGRPPFEAKTLAELKQEAPRGPSPSLRSIRPEVPQSFVDAILAAMAPSRSDRVRTAAELGSRFQTIARELGTATHAGTLSIAVLPFVNRSPGTEDEYFSDGLADELIGMLGKIRGLRVAARTSAFSFRGRQATVEEIGRALHVDTVLDGSIRRSGDRVRISVQLVKVSDGLHLWSETYDRTLDDIFAVQDDIAQSVVKELRAALLGDMGRDVIAEVANAARGRATDPAAHRLYLLGRYFITRLNREDLARAIQNLQEAVRMDPEFALGWAELGSAYTRAATFGLAPKEEAIRNAREAAERALAIEPDLVEAHARLAAIRMFHDWDWKGAEASYSRALELAPGDAVSLNGAGVLAMALGRIEESIALHRRASEQDPLSATPHANLGLTLYHAGRLTEAEASLRRALEIAPQRLLVHASLARALAAQGREEEALAEAAREPDEGVRLYSLAIVHHILGHSSDADAALREVIEGHGDAYAIQIAEVCALRGEIDATFEWLDKAYAQRDFGITEVQSVSSFRLLHPDPRWRSFMRRLGFEEDA